MSLNITLEVHKCCEKDNCIIIMFIAFLFCGQYRFVSFFPFVHPLFGPDFVQLFFLDCTLSFFPFYSHVHCPAPLPLFFLSSPHCVPLFPLLSPPLTSTRLWWVLQLALLQYRLSMSSMLCQPPAPPGSGTLHTYQVLLPFHSVPRASWR